MGNILETDSSVSSENEAEDNSVPEIRTEGDGMEAEKAAAAAGAGAVQVELPREEEDTTEPVKTEPDLTPAQQKQALLMETVKQLEGAYPRVSMVESPKQLPPRDKLIALKPPKLNDKTSADNATPYSKVLSSSSKQSSKEPKFVPYEPYKGATRPMVDDVKGHSRKASYSSTVSVGSVESSSKVEPFNTPPVVPYRNAMKKAESPTKSGAQIDSDSNLNQNHTVMLLKERLRIQEKDISELRTENTRLKKMLVDSLAGFGSPPSSATSSPAAHPSFHLGSNGNSICESVDNLTDEIEVWRSKFLSSCVLVEQLTKENHEWKNRSSSAAELFREIKQNPDVSLTPSLFNKINSWMHQSLHKPSKVSDSSVDGEMEECTSNHHHDIQTNSVSSAV